MVGSIVSALAYIIIGPIIGGLLQGFDRKLTARLQGRQGPPLLQPFYDLYKLFSKQSVVVNNIQDFLAPSFSGAEIFCLSFLH